MYENPEHPRLPLSPLTLNLSLPHTTRVSLHRFNSLLPRSSITLLIFLDPSLITVICPPSFVTLPSELKTRVPLVLASAPFKRRDLLILQALTHLHLRPSLYVLQHGDYPCHLDV